ncbi:methionine/alanine import family NSS transporter small subunit [Naasia sp. SYSU D00948]|uniref:methionine/alanine import family NSS transporter small subunit n=1 Tax=Naasia sp. SYSU D00948 TaxID=2817379 RepID=UPI001B30E1D7|nr:methionine/alanine import family NSS transporter small subunit [Naasia sp. SYSU D00948]
MSPVAIVFLVLAILVVWGGFAASTVFLARRPERTDYPPGAVDDHREDDAPAIRDT